MTRRTILNSPGLCDLGRDGNFIKVKSTCVTYMILQSFPYYLEHCLTFHAGYCDSEWRSMDEIAAVNYLESIDWIYAQYA